MPKTYMGKPAAQAAIEKDLRQRYGNFLRQRDIIEYLGVGRTTVWKMLRDVPAADATTRNRKYSPERIAREIYQRGEPGAWSDQ